MHSDKLSDALRSVIAERYLDKVIDFAEDEVEKLIASEKFRVFLQALVWNELRNAIMNMELLKMLPKELKENAVKTAIMSLIKVEI